LEETLQQEATRKRRLIKESARSQQLKQGDAVSVDDEEGIVVDMDMSTGAAKVEFKDGSETWLDLNWRFTDIQLL